MPVSFAALLQAGLMVLGLSGVQILPVLIYFCSPYWLFPTPYFVLAYLVNAWQHNSFTL